MLSLFRNVFKSKIGIAITLAFLGLIAFAFASSDVANTGTFGGVAGGNRIAVVGDEKISSSDLTTAANNALESTRRQNPTLSMTAFIAQDGLEDVVTQLIERLSLSTFGKTLGLRAGENLVNSEITQIPAFRGADGNFDQATYQAALRQQGVTDKLMRNDLSTGLIAQQLLVPAAFGAKMPDKMVSQYAALLKETRRGAIGIVLSTAYAPEKDATDKELQAFYTKNKADFIRPERRVIRYATFGEKQLGKVAAPTDREIAAFYEENRAEYAPSETRSVSQIIVPTEQAASAMRTRLQGGASIDTVAREAGLSVAKVENVTKEQLASRTSSDVATAVFNTDRGAIALPARSGLGFHVARVDTVNRKEGRNLAQARGDITKTLTEQKRRKAMADLAASTEELVTGGSLAEAAKELGVEVQSTKPVTAAGQIYGTQGQTAPQVLAPALATAFEMQESEPELAEIEAGKTFLIFEVSEITPSAAAPMDEIKDQLAAAWKLEKGAAEAKKATDRIMERVKKGSTLAAAINAEKKRLPPADTVNLSRQQLAESGQRIPPPLALMFSMAEGTTKRLEAPQNAGWFIVDLDKIEAGTISKDDDLFAKSRDDLAAQLSREYADQMRIAIQKDVKAERNDNAIEAVRKQLAGEN